jgi:hypothetical protein
MIIPMGDIFLVLVLPPKKCPPLGSLQNQDDLHTASAEAQDLQLEPQGGPAGSACAGDVFES